jgi:tRNA wybutosine-synthesizing protein 3
MSFELDKKNCLSKIDKSKKGNIDKKISKLIELINKNDNYFTTSSCSGRIMIYTKSKLKNKTKWFFVSHEKIKEINLNFQFKEQLWFKQESFILHLRAKDINSAEKIIKIARDIGLKRAGIQSINKHVNIEIYYHLKFDIPISNKEEILISKKHLNECIKIANNNLDLNFKKIKEFEKKIILNV